MNVVAVLTGRGNSTFKNKNILKIHGIPCMEYPCREAKKVTKIKYFFTSSDDNKILDIGKKLGFSPIKRPKKFSQSNSKHLDVLRHFLKYLKKNENIYPDIIVVLLANSPIIKSEWVSKCLNILIKNKSISAVVPVIENNDYHPLRAKRISKGYLRGYLDINNNQSTNRQDLEKNYFLCHNFWVIRTNSINNNNGFNPWKFMGKKVKAFKIKDSIDLHNQEDLLLAKHLIKKLNLKRDLKKIKN
jgi:CMP-N,N'-diacetyllegionaminic acid synthase